MEPVDAEQRDGDVSDIGSPTADVGDSGWTDADTSTPTDASAPPCAPITGTTPFGAHLEGTGPITDAGGWIDASGTVSAAVDLYFPSGRVPGGEVVAVGWKFGGGSVISYGVLDSTLSARGLRVVDPNCSGGVVGDLVGPADGIEGLATNNTSAPSDALMLVTGPVKMCAVGAVPEQRIDPPLPATLSPLAALTIRGSRPFARTSFASVSASTMEGPVPLTVTAADPGADIALSLSLFATTTIDISGLRDVLGGPLGLSTTRTIVPTAVLADLSFASAPSENAYVGGPISVASGVARIGNSYPGDAAIAIAIGSPAGKTSVRLRHRIECSPPSVTAGWSVSVIAADATSVVLRPACGSSFTEQTITLAGTGPYIIYASRERSYSRPCSYPSWAPYNVYELDQISFE